MALSIRNSETESLAVAAARLAGETGTEAVSRALRERLQRLLADLQPLTGHLAGHLVVTGAVAYDDYRPQCGRGLASAETPRSGTGRPGRACFNVAADSRPRKLRCLQHSQTQAVVAPFASALFLQRTAAPPPAAATAASS